jgi:hypothetical protein
LILTQLKSLSLSLSKLLQPKIGIPLPSAQASVNPPVSESWTPPEKETPYLPLCPISHFSFKNFPHLKLKHHQINARRFTPYNDPNQASPTRLLHQYAEIVVNLLCHVSLFFKWNNVSSVSMAIWRFQKRWATKHTAQPATHTSQFLRRNACIRGCNGIAYQTIQQPLYIQQCIVTGSMGIKGQWKDLIECSVAICTLIHAYFRHRLVAKLINSVASQAIANRSGISLHGISLQLKFVEITQPENLQLTYLTIRQAMCV